MMEVRSAWDVRRRDSSAVSKSKVLMPNTFPVWQQYSQLSGMNPVQRSIFVSAAPPELMDNLYTG